MIRRHGTELYPKISGVTGDLVENTGDFGKNTEYDMSGLKKNSHKEFHHPEITVGSNCSKLGLLPQVGLDYLCHDIPFLLVVLLIRAVLFN